MLVIPGGPCEPAHQVLAAAWLLTR